MTPWLHLHGTDVNKTGLRSAGSSLAPFLEIGTIFVMYQNVPVRFCVIFAGYIQSAIYPNSHLRRLHTRSSHTTDQLEILVCRAILKEIRAVEFITDWRRLSWYSGMSAVVAFPWSICDKTDGVTSDYKTDFGTDRQTLRTWCSTVKQTGIVYVNQPAFTE